MDVTIQLLTALNARESYNETLELYYARHDRDHGSPDESKMGLHLLAATAGYHLHATHHFHIAERTLSCSDYDRSALADFYRDQAIFYINVTQDNGLASRAILEAYGARTEHIPSGSHVPRDMIPLEQANYWKDQAVFGLIFEAEEKIEEAYKTLELVLKELTELRDLHADVRQQFINDVQPHFDRVAALRQR